MTKSTTLAAGTINHQSGAQLLIELIEPDGHPVVVRIVWPNQSSIVQPSKFNAVAADIMRLLASAVTKHTQIKAHGR